ncbi:MAG: hypothetical protein F2813_09085, partial [Actinobacteria bacterium]|nr:hypothetical protein [Actinomycetota bacterium]
MTEEPRRPTKSPSDPFAARPELEVVSDGHDVRRRRTPLSFILTLDALRSTARVISLVVVDAIAVYLAIFAALGFKALVQGTDSFSAIGEQAYHYAAFAVLLTVLLFVRAGLYGDRSSRPGLGAIVSALFSVAFVAFLYAELTGQQFSSYYIFWGTLIFAIITVGAMRAAYEAVSGRILRAAGYRRRALLVGAGAHAEAVAHALSASRSNPI